MSDFLISVSLERRHQIRAGGKPFNLRELIEAIAAKPEFLSKASQFAVSVRLNEADALAVKNEVGGWCQIGPLEYLEPLSEARRNFG